MTLRGLFAAVTAPIVWAQVFLAAKLGRKPGGRPLSIVQAVIEGPEGVLLSLRHDLNGWELPGGHVERGEADAEALAREVREEIGVEIEVASLVGTYVRTGFKPHEVRVYRARVVSGSPRATRESLAASWFARDALPDTLLPWCRTPLADAEREGAPVERTEHQGARAILETMRIDLATRAGRGR